MLLDEGDLIQRINRLNVTDLRSFNDIVAKLKAGDAVVLEVISYNPRDTHAAVEDRAVHGSISSRKIKSFRVSEHKFQAV